MGCRARGKSLCPGDDSFRQEDLPPHMWHYLDSHSQYLPVLPVAFHKLRAVEKKGENYSKTGKEVVISHLVLEAIIERQARSPEFMAAINCKPQTWGRES